MVIVREARVAWSLAACTLLILGSGSRAGAEEAARADAKPGAAKETSEGKPKTCKAEVGTIKVEVTLTGVVEAQDVAAVSLKPEAWTMPLTVEKSVENGTAVKRGDLLVELDLDKIDQAIKDLRNERSLTEAALKHAEEELPILEKLLPLDLTAADRAKTRADEDLARFLKTDRPLAEEGARFQVSYAQYWLDDARDELAQLEKMYRDKDLTEETEQMILRRHRFMVEMARFQLKSADDMLDRTLAIELPRREQSAREDAAKATLALERARSLLPLELAQKRLTRDKLRYEREKSDEKLAKLEADRKAMTVRAPADGIVFYGKAINGKWTAAADLIPKLQKGGVLPPQEVFMTLVTPRPASLRATVEEKNLHALRPKMEGKAIPAGYPELKLPARLAWFSSTPQTPGNFDAGVDLDLGRGAEMIMPGMACTVKFVSYRKDDALTVPATAVLTDDADEDVHYVNLATGEGVPRKRIVKVGKTGGDKAEILEGLKPGDEILSAKP
jgi:multidrug efflux pump subunit AcrA (membrane-fusion protein)